MKFPAHVTSFPAAVAPPEMADSAYQFSQVQKGAAAYGIDMPINPMQLAPQRSTTSSSSLSTPKVYFDSSHFHVISSTSKFLFHLTTCFRYTNDSFCCALLHIAANSTPLNLGNWYTHSSQHWVPLRRANCITTNLHYLQVSGANIWKFRFNELKGWSVRTED